MSAKVEATASNPAESHAKKIERLRKDRRPGIATRLKFEVTPIPGFYLHWFREERVEAAIKEMKYEHVKKREVVLNPVLIAGGGEGGTDLGENVSIIAGYADGKPYRAFLLKLYEELHNDDVEAFVRDHSLRLKGIFGDEKVVGEDGAVRQRDALMYTPEKAREGMSRTREALFQRPARKISIDRR